jgi:hypothetical protein
MVGRSVVGADSSLKAVGVQLVCLEVPQKQAPDRPAGFPLIVSPVLADI